jgi:hypothetical protein
MTDILPKRHQQAIDGYPVFFRQLFAQCHFGSVRVSGLHIAPTIANTMDVSIDTDTRQAESGSQHKVGGFAAYTG